MSLATSERPGDFSIVFDNISATAKKRTVLENASGFVRSGKLTAIVSCCGARGDYYMLNVLAGNHECTGTAVANGTPVVAPTFRQCAALIDDDLTLLEDLTVKQNVEYSASMRCAQSIQATELLVSEVMESLGLDEVANKEVKRCSDYVKKRVSFAKELVLNPSAIFADNPTHKMATHEARQLLAILQACAVSSTRAVVVSLVQPRWALLELVDDVILLEGTQVVFVGPTSQLIETVSLGPEQTPETTINAIYRTATSPSASLGDAFAKCGLQREVEKEVETFMQRCAEGEISFDGVSRKYPSSAWQFINLIKYSCLEVRNNMVLYAVFTLTLLVVATVLAAIYNSQTGQSGMQNRVGIIFFLISSTFLHNILFVDHHKRGYISFQRHRSQNYFGAMTYLIFNTVTSAFIRFFICSVFIIVVFSLANIDTSWDLTSLRDLMAIVALTSFSTSLVVYLVCAIAPSARIAHFVLFGIYTFNIILAGIILNNNTLPKPFQVLSYGSHIRLGYESALLSQFEGQTFGCVAPKYGNETSSCYTGDQYLEFLGFDEERKWKNVEVMLIMSGVCVVLIYVAMLVFTKTTRSTM